jgi:hypothetical protein
MQRHLGGERLTTRIGVDQQAFALQRYSLLGSCEHAAMVFPRSLGELLII